MADSRASNRLARESSPYLLQHAHNPVDWYPWGPEALERARREDKPILLSIGYAACHWCHVMERESFENAAIARLMNDGFVCIKVDREERPDIDDIYMAATLALNGHGGWPMTVFMTPEQEPFFAGTYFPPETRGQMIGFGLLVSRIRELWDTQRAGLRDQAARLSGHLRALAAAAPPSPIPAETLLQAVDDLREVFDPVYGGFGTAPKFPPAASIALLLRHHARSRDASALHMARATLDGMKNGGMYDHLGGGFARYSTDERWLVPHFEKMLYDNAQLASVYVEAFQLTHDPEYARVARETLDYVMREMQAPEGGYYSSTDADSEGVEGKFFVFTRSEIMAALEPALARLFCEYYGVTAEGNWEGQNVLHTACPLAEVAARLDLDVERAAAMLATARELMYRARAQRVPPQLDDKVLTSWNGLMIAAMADGARVLGEARYLESAERAARFAMSTLTRSDGSLYRTARHGQPRLAGYLEDHAFLADGLISLYEAAGRGSSPALREGRRHEEYLHAAVALTERMLREFSAEDGAFYTTARDHEELLLRARDAHDGALPSANAVAARVLARLGRHLGRGEWLERAVRALEAAGSSVTHAPRAFATALGVLEFCRSPSLEVVVIGRAADSATQALLDATSAVYLPNAVYAFATPERAAALDAPPLVKGKGLVAGAPAVYICRNFTCVAPLTDAAAVEDALGGAAAAAPLEPAA